MSILNLFSFFTRPASLSQTAIEPISGENYSGKCVNAGTALTLSTVWACVKLISESVASLPCGVYEKDKEGHKVPLNGENIYGILHDSPNADMSAFDFWQVIVASTLLWGNAYVLKTTRNNGEIISLEPLNPAAVERRINQDGSYTYFYTDPERHTRKEYPEDRIVVFKGLSLNGKTGLSVIKYGMNSFGSALALDETSGRLYSNGMRPGGALKMPGILKAEQRKQVRENIAEQIGGVAKTGGTIILEGGMEYQSLTIPPEDAQMLESKSFSVSEICRWFGVPPALIGHTEKTTTWGTGLEQMNLGFVTYCLRPHLTRIEQEIKRSLLTAREKARGVYAEFNVEGFLRADSVGRAALYSSASQNGWMSRAEIRRKENLPYIEGSEVLTVQSALVPLDQIGKKAPTRVEDTEKV